MTRKTQTVHFVKMQGVGNDFIVVDGRGQAIDWPAFALSACHRRTGIGADGLLVVENSEVADVRMRMFNPDGTEDICGNGMRCVARYVYERKWVTGHNMTIEVLDGVRAADYNYSPDGHFASISVVMGNPHFAPEKIPMQVSLDRVVNYPLELPGGETLTITALSTGSTHTVTFVEELPDDARFFSISPQVENHPLFPERTSLMWCRVTGPKEISLRIWERGAGETWGCGTGACAAAVAAIVNGYILDSGSDFPVIVASRGGELLIEWYPGNPLWMTGPAEFVFEGVYEFSP